MTCTPIASCFTRPFDAKRLLGIVQLPFTMIDVNRLLLRSRLLYSTPKINRGRLVDLELTPAIWAQLGTKDSQAPAICRNALPFLEEASKA